MAGAGWDRTGGPRPGSVSPRPAAPASTPLRACTQGPIQTSKPNAPARACPQEVRAHSQLLDCHKTEPVILFQSTAPSLVPLSASEWYLPNTQRSRYPSHALQSHNLLHNLSRTHRTLCQACLVAGCAPKSTGVPEDTSRVQAASSSCCSHSSPTEQPKQEHAWSPSDQMPRLLHAALLRSCSGTCMTGEILTFELLQRTRIIPTSRETINAKDQPCAG